MSRFGGGAVLCNPKVHHPLAGELVIHSSPRIAKSRRVVGMIDANDIDLVDMDKALLDPGSVFPTPEVVLQHNTLTVDQKVEILRRWEYDASEICVAVEEGMPNGESDLLRRIVLALNELTGGIDVGRVGPTKQHGIPRSAVKEN